jgi:hypothetical protein
MSHFRSSEKIRSREVNKMAKSTKEEKKQLDEKKPQVKSGTKNSCGCGCILPVKKQ